MKEKIVFISTFLLMAFHAPAQVKNLVLRAAAYYKTQGHGAQLVDENGNPVPQKPSIIHWVVLETQNVKIPVIDSVFYMGQAAEFSITEIKDKAWEIGKIYSNNKKAGWKFQKKSQVWLIEFKNQTAMPEGNSKLIKLKGKPNKKNLQLNIIRELELEPDIVM
jgi:hypothetical protein